MFALATGTLTALARGATIDTLDFTESNWSLCLFEFSNDHAGVERDHRDHARAHYALLMGTALTMIGLLRRRETRASEVNELFAAAARADPRLPLLPTTDSK